MADKEQKAIARLQEAAFYSERLYNGAPLIVTTSGGKDSDVCLTLAQRSGIRFEVMHNHTTADAPETVYHVRETFQQAYIRAFDRMLEERRKRGLKTDWGNWRRRIPWMEDGVLLGQVSFDEVGL